MGKEKGDRRKLFQDPQLNLEYTTRTLINDGALPSPIVSLYCSNDECSECYANLAVLTDRGHVKNRKKEDYVRLGSLKAVKSPLEVKVNKKSPTESGAEESEEEKLMLLTLRNLCIYYHLKKVLLLWKTEMPRLEKKSGSTIKYIESRLHDVCVPGYVMKSAHNDKCASCRRDYEPIYQEFGVFIYPAKKVELGAPLLFYGKLSDGSAIARTFQLYFYNSSDQNAKSDQCNEDRGKSSYEGDVALLEMVDPDLVTTEDYHVLRLNGFAHEINANGTIYLARGIVFSGLSFDSKCMFKAAVETRGVAHFPKKHQSSIVCCTETIKNWLEIMGYNKRGFSVIMS
ncbi:unnamed protein product [Haemonchus placei]|uniref:SET domain-containing protein n=1 Tax=Haemonchus placei TaxID=6290 RepID=A0A0N4WFL7_HAEPC|nr:unnamed protein product [Haemonchus placei]